MENNKANLSESSIYVSEKEYEKIKKIIDEYEKTLREKKRNKEKLISISSKIIKTLDCVIEKTYYSTEFYILPDSKLPNKYNLIIENGKRLILAPLDGNQNSFTTVNMENICKEKISSYSISQPQKNNTFGFSYEPYLLDSDQTIKWVENFVLSSSESVANGSGITIDEYNAYADGHSRSLWNKKNIVACLFHNHAGYFSWEKDHFIKVIDPSEKKYKIYSPLDEEKYGLVIHDFAWNRHETYTHVLAYLTECFSPDVFFSSPTEIHGIRPSNRSALYIIDCVRKRQAKTESFDGVAKKLAWSSCGEQLAVYVRDKKAKEGSIKVLNVFFDHDFYGKLVPNSRMNFEICVGKEKVKGIAYGKYHVLAALYSSGKIVFFNTVGKKIYEIDTHLSCPNALYWSQDGKYIVASDKIKVKVWTIEYVKNFKKAIQKEIAQAKFEYEPQVP